MDVAAPGRHGLQGGGPTRPAWVAGGGDRPGRLARLARWRDATETGESEATEGVAGPPDALLWRKDSRRGGRTEADRVTDNDDVPLAGAEKKSANAGRGLPDFSGAETLAVGVVGHGHESQL